MNARCPRRWEVEAAFDRRLAESAQAALRRHSGLCSECKQARQQLEGLRRQLQEQSGLPDDVSLRRLRQLVLERADRAIQTRAEAPRQSHWRSIAAALALAAGGGALIAHQFRAGRQPSAELAIVRPSDAATSWSRRRTGDTEEIRLSDGVLSLDVNRRSGDPRVIVRVPDGEIEDQGTAFVVKVANGRTVEISVSAGWVRFRRPGEADVQLPAGATWLRPLDLREAPGEQSRASSAPAPLEELAAPSAPAKTVHARSHAAPQARVAPLTDASRSELEDEDEAYLQVLRSLRQGRQVEARERAALYLQKFPHAFRRAEIEGLTGIR